MQASAEMYFGGKLPSLKNHSGAGITLANSEPPSVTEYDDIMFDGTYSGLLPTHARDEYFASWVKVKSADRSMIKGKNCAVKLQFGSSLVNLGQITCGHLKACIDCLYPVIGGVRGASTDEIISVLQVEKGSAGVPPNGVRVQIAQI